VGGQAPHPRLAATEPFYRRGVQTNQLLHDVNELDLAPRREKEFVSSGRLDCMSNGGADRDRTGDLKLAKLALSQLSYGPIAGTTARRAQRSGLSFRHPARFFLERTGGPGTTRTSDLTLIRRAL
jgi:hypothetical protein